MKKVLFILFALMLQLPTMAQVLEPITWTHKLEDLGNNEYNLMLTATMDQGWHLYSEDVDPAIGPIPTTFYFTDSTGITANGKFKATINPIVKYDPSFNADLEFYEHKVTFQQKIKVADNAPAKVSVMVDFMGCNDKTCIPPADYEAIFKIKAEQKNANIASATSNEEKGGLLSFFIFAFIGGLLALLTPCVFPMIPMTVSFFTHGQEGGRTNKLPAVVFGLSIILIYTLIGTLVAALVGPGFANWLSTHWLPNIIFFAVFIFFAASFFGMFEIVLPSWMVNGSVKNEEKGGIIGAFFMALTLVIVSFSCTGPIVGSVLVQSAGGAILLPIVAMFGFSLAFALPFTFFAFVPKLLNGLPKSGGWLNSVKVCLGFIEIALGLKFLSIADQTYHWGLLDREVYIAIWIVVFTMMGFYLLGKMKFSHDSEVKFISVPRLFFSIVTFSFVVYLIPGMIGAPLKGLSGYLPPQSSHDFDLHQVIRNEVKTALITSGVQGGGSVQNVEGCVTPKYGDKLHLPHGLQGYYTIEEAVACATAQNKPIFLDFTGHGCVNCRQMEANVWSDPRVLQRLERDYVILALYVDDKTTLPESEWITSKRDGRVKKTLGKINADYQISRFNVNAQPYYVLLDHNMNKLTLPKAYDLNPDNFVQFLDAGVEAFKAQQK